MIERFERMGKIIKRVGVEKSSRAVTFLFLLIPALLRAESPSVTVERLYRHNILYADRGLSQLSMKAEQEVLPVVENKEQKPRSVFTAGALSLLVPGAGQFYVGDKFRAVPFFLVDVGGWVTYFGLRAQGKNRERDYRAFADLHYDAAGYFNFLQNDLGINSRSDYDPVGRDYCRRDSVVNLCVDSGFLFSHHIPSKKGGPVEKNFEYYENLGKYDQFFAGWDDYNAGVNRRAYLKMRSRANDSFSRSKIGIIVSLADRLVAAFDAAMAAKRFNKKINKTNEIEIGFRVTRYNGARMPKLTATYKF